MYINCMALTETHLGEEVKQGLIIVSIGAGRMDNLISQNHHWNKPFMVYLFQCLIMKKKKRF